MDPAAWAADTAAAGAADTAVAGAADTAAVGIAAAQGPRGAGSARPPRTPPPPAAGPGACRPRTRSRRPRPRAATGVVALSSRASFVVVLVQAGPTRPGRPLRRAR